MQSEIPFIKPSFPRPDELAEDFGQIVDANWYTNFGPKEQQFTRALSDYLGDGLNTVTFANGTSALMAALHVAVGRGSMDSHLLMPSFTFVAVAEAAIWSGYQPWFVDVDPLTWQPSLQSARTALETSRNQISGILLANVFGVGNPDIGDWEDLADQWQLPLVIDSAAGFGSSYADGRRVGARGACEIFSFHATKPFAVGEGGALVSRDPRIIARAHEFANFGFSAGRECTHLGMNAKLPEISAAIGLRQLEGLNDRLASRRDVFQRYTSELSAMGLTFQPNALNSSLCFASACCASTEQKASTLASLHKRSIEARDYYNPPQHLHPYFRLDAQRSRSTDMDATEDICSRIISLPVHDHMTSDDVERVIAAVEAGAA